MRKTLEQLLMCVACAAIVAGCSTTRNKGPTAADAPDGGPNANPPSATGNPESYVVFGQRYFVLNTSAGFQEQGLASWYGEDFHGKRTSSGVPYDMYAMTAAHKNLPIPTFVRVSNLENGRSIVVEVNDRGPFVDGRIIDLSYVAASKLGIVGAGTARVEVTALPPYQYLPGASPAPNTYLAQAGTTAPRPAPSLAGGIAGTVPATPMNTDTHDPQANPTLNEPNSSLAIYQTSSVPSAALSANVRQSAPTAKTVAAPAAFESGPAVSPAINASYATDEVVYQGTAADDLQPLYLQVGAFSDRRNAELLQSRLSDSLNRMIRIELDTGQLYKVRVGPIETLAEADQVTLQLAALGIDRPHLVAQ